MNRREFVKTTAMAAASVAAGTSVSEGASGPVEGKVDARGVRWQKAPCRFCGTGCHAMVGVKGGRVVAIAGDRQAEVNRGLLCVKGYHVGLALYGRDRLTRPLLRQGDRQVPISWERALEIIAQRI